MRIVHKPVALAWRQRASAALRARAAATLPYRAFVNNSHDFGTYKNMKFRTGVQPEQIFSHQIPQDPPFMSFMPFMVIPLFSVFELRDLG